jgi:hypothetical protein
VLGPNGEGLEGGLQVTKFNNSVPETGEYVVRVGMMRAGARKKGSVSNFTLSVTLY